MSLPLTGAGPSAGIVYLLHDKFTDTRAAGSVNGTAATPGPGTRTVTDTDGDSIAITSGNLVFTNPNTNWISSLCGWSESFSRIAGRLLIITANLSATNKHFICGWGTIVSSLPGEASLYFNMATCTTYSLGIALFSVVASTDYQLALILRSSGWYTFVKGGVFTNWTLLYSVNTGNNTPLYVSCVNHSVPTVLSSYARIPDALWLPTPLAYDTFTRADGVPGNSETTGPDGQAAPAIAWVQQSGSWEISGNQLQTAAGGAGIITIPTGGNGDFVIEADITTPAAGTTPAGLVVRFTDTNNYWYLKMTPGTAGTDFELVEVNAGVPTTRASSDEDWVAATQYNIKCAVEGGDEWRVFVDNVTTLTYTTSNTFNQSAAGVGFRDEGAQNFKFDNLAIFPRGTGNEYSQLDKY